MPAGIQKSHRHQLADTDMGKKELKNIEQAQVIKDKKFQNLTYFTLGLHNIYIYKYVIFLLFYIYKSIQ